MQTLLRSGLTALVLTQAVPVSAGEVIAYTYDARGRLTKVERSGTAHTPVSTGTVTTTYTLDRADNRTKKETINSTNSGPP